MIASNGNHQIIDGSDPPLIRIMAEWSPNYLNPGAATVGELTLSSTIQGQPISLGEGDLLALIGLPTSWGIESKSFDWDITAYSYRGTTTSALKYTGNGGSSSTVKIELDITPPENAANKEVIELQLLNDSKVPLSDASSIIFNLTEASAPLIAFSDNPAVVLLSSPGDIDFANMLSCTLLNQGSTTIDSATLTLSFLAQGEAGEPVDIEQDLDDVSVGGDLSWIYNSETYQWAASLNKPLTSQMQVSVKISGLSLSQASISLLEAKFQVSGIAEQQAYNSAAWFQAHGPYAASVVLDTSQPTADKFSLVSSASPGSYTVNHLDPSETAPPLFPQLLNANGQAVYPPVPGSFSWQETSIDFPTVYSLSPGENTLYFLVGAVGSADSFTVLTSCEVALNLLTRKSHAPLIFSTKNRSGSCFGMSLNGQNFSGWANLTGANFQETNLTDANLTDANLTGANLSGANLSGATLDGVISGGIGTNEGTKLPSPWQIQNGYLIGPGANLRNANLANAYLVNATLTKADLSGANLTEANLTAADLSSATLEGANLTEVNLAAADLSSATLEGANLKLARIGIGILGSPVSIRNANFTNADLTETGWFNVNLSNANFTNANIANSALEWAFIEGADFSGANFSGMYSNFLTGIPGALPAGWQIEKLRFVQK